MKRDYYEVLGVPKDATLQQIKKKYRSLALKYHPDRVEESGKKKAEEKFKEISESYAVLSDPKKKQMYDQYGHAGIDQNFTREDIFSGADFGDLGDIFSQFFGGGGSPFGDIFGGGSTSGRRAHRGQDIQFEMEISLEEAFSGVKKKIHYPRYEHCKTCQGSGAKPGSTPKTCPTCKGSGRVVMSSGFFRMQQACPDCGGAGQVITEYCPDCHGKGRVRVDRKIEVSIPKGVDSNSRLRVQNEGEVGEAGNGDLYLYINVRPHPVYQRQGNDLHMDQNVSFVIAALGGEVRVPTLEGHVTMKVPPGTQSGKIFRLKGKGMPNLRTGMAGEMYVRVMISVPAKLDTDQREILEKYAEVSGEQAGGKAGIADKIKNVFK